MPFSKGHKLSKGRPKGSKNLLPLIRDKVLAKLYLRIKELDTIEVTELLSFAKTIMPKEVNLSVRPDITYISSTPRPSTCIPVTKQELLEAPKVITKEEVVLSKSSSITIDNDIHNSSNSSNDNDTHIDNSISMIDNNIDITEVTSE